jgi:hypothetical protein
MNKETPTPSRVPSTSRRWLSPTLFALIALAFMLPFATVSCDGAKTTFTGVQLVTHTVPDGGVVDEPPDCSTHIGTCVEHASSNTATVALVMAIVGLVLGLFGIARGPGWCALVGFAAMAWLPVEGGMSDVTLRSGWQLAFFGFLVVGLLHIRRAWVRGRTAGPIRPRSQPPGKLRPIPDLGHISIELEQGERQTATRGNQPPRARATNEPA